MLPAAEADLQAEASGRAGEGGGRIGGLVGPEAEPGKRLVKQLLLPRAQRVPAEPPVKALRGRLDPLRQRLNALWSAGTRSVRSQVKVSRASSGSRPKCP